MNFDEDEAFEVVGLDDSARRIYRYILAGSAVTPEQVAAAVPLEGVDVRAVLARLRDVGLVNRVSGADEYTGVDPRMALRSLTERTAGRLDRVRAAIPELAEVFERAERGNPTTNSVRFINERGLIGSWYVRLEHEATSEFLTFDRPPYVLAPDNPVEPLVLARGVDWRSVYDDTVLDIPGAWADMRHAATVGERARIGHALPTKLAIADRRIALVTTELELEHSAALVVEARPLVDLLVAAFEAVWERAVELPPTDSLDDLALSADRPSGQDLAILGLFGAGAKDAVIARELGLSARTLRRRTADLLERLGARNRFQAGVEAAKRGWL
jgi:hypothetical protein